MSMKIYEPHKSSIGGIDANIIAIFCYLVAAIVGLIPVLRYFAWLAPLAFYFMDKESSFVKFHAMQAFVLNLAGAILGFLLSVVLGGLVGASVFSTHAFYAAFGFAGIISLIATIISITIIVFAVIAMVNAYNYKEYRIPLAGNIADMFSRKINNK